MTRVLVSVLLSGLLLSGCGGGGDGASQTTTTPQPQLQVQSVAEGVTQFIRIASLQVQGASALSSAQFEIAPRAGSKSRSVLVQYDRSYLLRRGWYDEASHMLRLPLFGLYAGRDNQVQLTARFADGSQATTALTVTTPAYVDAKGVYDHLTVHTPRSGDVLAYDFVMLKPMLGAPVVLDTDGELRWMGQPPVSTLSSQASIFTGSDFLVGSNTDATLYRLYLDGGYDQATVQDSSINNFHHDILPGKTGYLVELDTQSGGVQNIESVLEEVDGSGQVLKRWDLAQILRDTIRAGGEDPAPFIRDGVDWFHMNSAIYDARDDSVIVSSRENFVLKLDYATGTVKWILGDTSKYWYTQFASLRALTLALNDAPPVGQHALSITPYGDLMMFDNGKASLNNPYGTSAGINNTVSAAISYNINTQTRSAYLTSRFIHPEQLYSPFCSSTYLDASGGQLIGYAVATDAQGVTTMRLVGRLANGVIAFDYGFPTAGCATGWNARAINLHGMMLQ
ncbi:Arylsulfotransferase (ASST) [Andreprevotia lacus DSM 23236]|uniref:Arylsulfotransferase (ASST) n=1 Tax=Andreprevotia lacus DSM 23236 TaxID=1121001 RepID=A0A1W1XJX9_9NEIS|nr:aryl-sulfate sulfotransferase [Andreprevotia lacus]SMC24286.1 Arylsulfotransferase (ASST) [Andreprevotia lacus DSM 23236]